MTIRHALGTMLLLTLTACGPFGVETTDVSNQGTACVQDDAVIVSFTRCVGGCTTLVDASCEASVDGDTLTVTSVGTLEKQTNIGDCSTECDLALAECTLTGNLDGVTRIAYAGEETEDLDCPVFF